MSVFRDPIRRQKATRNLLEDHDLASLILGISPTDPTLAKLYSLVEEFYRKKE